MSNNELNTDYNGEPWQTVEPFKSLFAAKITAETKRILAEAEKTENERNMSKAALVTIEAESRRAVIAAEQADVLNRREMARDRYNHVMRFNGSVTRESVNDAIDELTIWHRTAPACDIEIVFDSPGGDAIHGMDLYDYIQELKRSGHNFTIAARGMAASMGGILLQAGLPTPEAPRSKRVAGKEAHVLLHEISSVAIGKVGEIEDEMVFVRKVQDRVLGIFETGSRYAFEHGTSEIALTREQLIAGDPGLGIKGWLRRDWWLDSDECKRYGIVDELR
jgi:ATP-dependent protease ClpP protease subunit